MDRNTVIGFVLLAVLLFVYLFTATRNSQNLEAEQHKKQDSLARIQKVKDSLNATRIDTTQLRVIDSSGFQRAGTESLVTVENEVLKIVFSNKGGQPKSVELKKYKTTYDKSKPVVLESTPEDKISYSINNGNQAMQTADLYFKPAVVTKNADNSQTIDFVANGPSGEAIHHRFTLRPDSYLVDWNLEFSGADKLLTAGNLNLNWHAQPQKLETDVTYERTQTILGYYEDKSFDYLQAKTNRKLEKAVKWVSVSQQFFNTTLVAGNSGFSSGELNMTKNTTDTADRIADISVTLQAKLPVAAQASFPMQVYYGPNDFKTLKKQPVEDFDEIVNLGRDMYRFVRPINKYIVLPVFDFLGSLAGSMGIAILLLTVFIRLITSPLMYPGYKTSAQMKVLKPDLAKLKEKYPDQQTYAMEQMKFLKEAGVSQFAGCLPSLLQIPIFFALYSFFNSSIALRGEEFLWAHNLSSYDVIVKFPFNLWPLGNHLSLFTLTAAATSFLISLYNSNMTPDQSNPALKYMPYIFPFILLIIFNRLPAALTWYYTVSNIITLILQFVIQKYIINHDKIVAKIDENRKKPKSKSKWQERFEQMQESQKKMQEMKNKQQKG